MHKPKTVTRIALVALVGLRFFFGNPLTAQTAANWQAGTGNWSVASNWNCGMGFPSGCVPNPGTTVGISNGGSVILDINATSQDLFLDSGSSLSAGTGTSLSNTGPFTVGLNGQGSLTIQNGGRVLTSGAAFSGVYIGFSAGSAGKVTVSGPGSHLAGDFVTVGNGGQGSLTIQNGGQVTTSGGLYMGYYSGSSGNLTVSGSGSQLTAAFANVGGSGVGTATVNSGGLVNVGSTAIDGGGAVTVSGAGSQWNTPEFLNVGVNGQGQLNVGGGGVVTSGQTRIGFNSGSMGTVEVSGTGAQWNNTGSLIVGAGGQGTLTVQNGGVVTTSGGSFGGLYLGDAAGSNGGATVSGSGSRLTADFVTVGNSGQGSLTIQNGGQVSTAGGLYVGFSSGSSGNVTVSGSGSQLTAAFANVGGGGVGTVTVNPGGVVNVGSVGACASTCIDGGGTVTVSGAGSQWNSSGDLTVGQSGNGTLMIASGGRVNNVNGNVGLFGGSMGTVTVSGDGSQWNNSGGVFVGGAGQGNITLQGGAAGRSGNGVDVGVGPGATATVTLTGVGVTSTPTSWMNTGGTVIVGDLGTGTLNVQNGAEFVTTGSASVGVNGTGALQLDHGTVAVGGDLTIGGGTTGTGRVTLVAGSDLELYNGGQLLVGDSGNGQLNLNGSQVSDGLDALVDKIIVGNSGTGTLALYNSSSIVTGQIALAINNGSSGSLIVDHSTISAFNVVTGSSDSSFAAGTATITLNSGSLDLKGLYFSNGSFTSTGSTVSVLGNFTSFGSVGNTTVSFKGSSLDATGNIDIEADPGKTTTVRLDNSTWGGASFLQIGDLTLGVSQLTLLNGSMIQASNIIIGEQGSVTIQDSTSTLSGNVTDHGSLILDPSMLDVVGDFTLAPDGTLVLDIDGAATGLFSMLNISGLGLFNGTIDLDFIDGFAPQTGDSFDFINVLGAEDFSGAKFQIDGLEPGFVYTDTFSNGSFDLVAQNDGVSTTATPEPSSVWLLASALVILCVAVWRKTSKAQACPAKGSSV